MCQEAALTRRTSWGRSRGGAGLGLPGKQLYPATPELTAWREGPADGSQYSAEQMRKKHVIKTRDVPPDRTSRFNKISHGGYDVMTGITLWQELPKESRD